MYSALNFAICVFLATTVTWTKVDGKKCPSYCTNDTSTCISKGGRVVGHCTDGLPCCDLTFKGTGSCGVKLGSDSKVIYFTSPKYPAVLSRDLVCPFTFQLMENVVGVMLEFVNFISDGTNYGAYHGCDSDMLFIRGFPTWMPPPFCGDLTKYKVLIDDSKLENVKDITLLAVMSSNLYRWKIKITQITRKDCGYDAPENETSASSSSKQSRKLRLGSKTKSDLNERRRRQLRPMVVNGVDTPSGKVPWQASIRMDLSFYKTGLISKTALKKILRNCDLNEGLHTCGGSIISENEILTAAHCFHPVSKQHGYAQLKRTVIVLGDVNKCRDGHTKDNATERQTVSMVKHKFGNPDVQVYNVESVMLHYSFDTTSLFNDIAIVKIKGKIRFNDKVNKIDLAEESDDFTGRDAFVSGWGRTDLLDATNKGSDVLQSSDNLIIPDQSICNKHTLTFLLAKKEDFAYSEKYGGLLNSTLCSDSKNKTLDVLVGEGDSGGPLVVFDKNTSNPILVGVVSFGNHVNRQKAKYKTKGDFVDYYQSVAYYRNWIDTAMCAGNLPLK